MTGARKIKMPLRSSLLRRKSGFGTKTSLWKQRALCPRVERDGDAVFVYLFLSALPVSMPVHFGNTDIPARKHRISSRRTAVLFYRRLGKRASFVMDRRERSTMRIVHCRCIKDLRHRQLHRRQNGRSLARDCPRLTLLKVLHWSCQPGTKPFPLFPTRM